MYISRVETDLHLLPLPRLNYLISTGLHNSQLVFQFLGSLPTSNTYPLVQDTSQFVVGGRMMVMSRTSALKMCFCFVIAKWVAV
jgi:hypothetical protein